MLACAPVLNGRKRWVKGSLNPPKEIAACARCYNWVTTLVEFSKIHGNQRRDPGVELSVTVSQVDPRFLPTLARTECRGSTPNE